MMRDKLIVMVVLAWLIFGFSASALEYSPDCAEFSNKTTDWSRTLSVDKFDPSLGVLTGVKVSADACASQLFMLDSEDSEPQCWTVTTNARLSAAMPDGTDFVLSLPEKTNQFCLSADLDEEPDFAGNDSFRFFIKECVKDERTYSDLANWIGPGKVDFKVVAKGITDVAGSSSFDQRVRTFANETICVTYYYEPCDDGLWCNGEETSNGLICLPGTAPDCNDGIECTIDSCNEETDTCEHRADDSKCDDGLWCNGAETCDPTKGCQPGTAPDCSDGIDCTIDSCNEEIDECEHSPDDDFCDDYDVCNGIEICDPASGCLPGTSLDCDDKDPCTIDSCDPIEGCIHTAIDCDDGDPCTIDECINGRCVHTQIPGCGCDCSANAPDICLPMVCIERGGVLICKDYSLPQYLPQVKNKVMSAGGGCTGDCKSFNLVLPSSIKWNTPGPYEYSVVCEDASKTCSSTDTGRLVLDYNCGCGACGCSGFC
ncbi:choice-of-anchor E domain-containing protein [Methanothrix sp.]|uniref:choice-of-anchor E domain-containing protein n=1 Tax=Methanothrix sp. TaxID=90426 RepID=UPI003C71D1BA